MIAQAKCLQMKILKQRTTAVSLRLINILLPFFGSPNPHFHLILASFQDIFAF